MLTSPDGKRGERDFSGRGRCAKAPVEPPLERRGKGVFGLGCDEVCRISSGVVDAQESRQDADTADVSLETSERTQIAQQCRDPSAHSDDNPKAPHHHAVHGEDDHEAAARRDQHLRRDPSGELEQLTAQAPPPGVDERSGGRVGEPRQSQPRHCITATDQAAQPEQAQEVRLAGVCVQGLGAPSFRERNNVAARGKSFGLSLRQCGKLCSGCSRVRTPCEPDLRGAGPAVSSLRRVGHHNAPGDRGDEPSAEAACGMAAEGLRCERASGEAEDEAGSSAPDVEDQGWLRDGAGERDAILNRSGVQCGRSLSRGPDGAYGDHDGDDEGYAGGAQGASPDGTQHGRAAPEEGQVNEGCLRHNDRYSMSTSPSPSATGSNSRDLSQEEVWHLDHKAQSLVPGLMQQLVANDGLGGERPVLMEVACAPDSALTQAVREAAAKPQAAVRCALWNSGDLSTNEGLKFVLDRIQMEQPQNIWINLPGTAFSPMQLVNQRTEAQKERLAEQRREAMKVYVGACCVFHMCMQRGIHCTFCLPERCEAWRLPLFQSLQQRYHLGTAVTKGCQVGFRSQGDKRLLQWGWKLMSSHKRLLEQMDLPCRCGKQYQHGRCESLRTPGPVEFTEAYVRKVAEVLCQEFSYGSLLKECEGLSELPESFGNGESCTCGESKIRDFHMTCANCISGREELGYHNDEATETPQVSDSRDPKEEETQEQSMYTQSERQQAEALAAKLTRLKQYAIQDVQPLLELMSTLRIGRTRHMVPGTKAPYHVFGLYSHGKSYGVTNKTTLFPHVTTYVNQWLKQNLPKGARWTSFALSTNNRMPIHRDNHNDPNSTNYVLGVGTYKGGELWTEAPPGYTGPDACSQESIDGKILHGRKIPTLGQCVTFSPKAWHGTCAWTGDRYTVTAYVSRGDRLLEEDLRKELQTFGFGCSEVRPRALEQGLVLQRDGRWKRNLVGMDKSHDERIKKQLYLLHAATGHGSTRHLVDALRRRGASARVLALARDFQCSVCQERRRVGHRHMSTLEPLPPRWSTISADVGHWTHPQTKEQVQFMVIVDECSRFRAARILTTGSKQQPNAQACLNYLQEGWMQYFGRPQVLRLDPAGSFRSQYVESFCDRHKIFLDIIPGEAHWKLGICEQAVQGLKEVMTKTCLSEEGLSAEEALAVSVMTFNHRDVVRGFSPVQHALGHNPDQVGPVMEVINQAPVAMLWEDPQGEVERAAQLRAAAEGAHASWTARQRILRAQNSRGQRVLDFQPGELVYLWRAQTGQQGRRQPGDKHGSFIGPARILATEKKKDESGHLVPGSSVWLVRGRSLLKCCPEQLRRASEREELLEVLAKPEDRTPWTFQRVAAEIGGNQVKDYSHHKPTEREWSNAQNEEETPPPVRTRFRGKRALPASAEAPMEEDEAQPQTSTASSSRARLGEIQGCGFQVAEAWWAAIPEDHWEDRPAAYWSEEGAAVSVEIELPTNPRGLQRTLQHLPTYFVGAMKRRAVEVCERKLTEPQKEEFRNAKNVEVRNFIASKAFEVLPEELKPSREQAINMRWILTWKTTDSGGQKAKARAVLLGYQDPKYEHRATTAPVMTRQTRQMQLQISTNRGWMVQKGDVSGAFLQGREYPDQLFCVPCKEICEAMGLPEGTITRLRRACYGLVDAPLEWYRTVDEYLCELGLVRTHADACAWVWRPQGELRGMISGHVDDFLFSGRADDVQWQALLEKIRQRFKWGDWDQDKFVQCGVQVERTSEGFLLSQPHYLEGIKEIPLSSSRRKAKDAPTGEREKTQLRALLGGLSWHAQQVAPHLSAEVSLLLSEISESTVSTIIKANLLAYHAKARQDHQMLIHRFAAEEPLALFGWVDAASQNRREGGSTQGIFIGMGPANMLQGELGRVTPIAWHSNKIDRSCRSPGAAEAQAAVNGEDALYFARYQWSELCYGDVNIRHPDNTVAKVTGCLVTDSRNVYDKLQTEVLVIKGAEKRTNIELLSIKEAQRNHGVLIRWVHSEAQLANALTKHGSRELELYYRMRHSWRIVEDPEMMSARRRKTAGLEPLATGK